jgi:hypothetical protein
LFNKFSLQNSLILLFFSAFSLFCVVNCMECLSLCFCNCLQLSMRCLFFTSFEF